MRYCAVGEKYFWLLQRLVCGGKWFEFILNLLLFLSLAELWRQRPEFTYNKGHYLRIKWYLNWGTDSVRLFWSQNKILNKYSLVKNASFKCMKHHVLVFCPEQARFTMSCEKCSKKYSVFSPCVKACHTKETRYYCGVHVHFTDRLISSCLRATEGKCNHLDWIMWWINEWPNKFLLLGHQHAQAACLLVFC